VVGAPMSTVQFFFSLHATHSAQLPFFPFWFLAHDVDVMCAVCETTSPATRHGLGYCVWVALVSKQATAQD
jgi:hypothetical protein